MTHVSEEELAPELDAVLIEAYGQLREKTLQSVREAPPGRERNRACACGSGRKTKTCAPSHPPTPAELDALRDLAEWEDARHALGYAERTQKAVRTLGVVAAVVGGDSW